MDIKNNLAAIQSRVAKACASSGRTISDVELMLVTKTVSVEDIFCARNLGGTLFGENKVQEVVQKWHAPSLEGVRPDFIGHLQTNKVKTCLDVCARIHSVDRMGLVEALDRELQKRGERREVFLQVNTSAEESKYGVSLNDAVSFATRVAQFQTLHVTGLMTLAEFSQDMARVRECFRRLKEVQREIRQQGLFSENFRHLSMGMSSDFEIAIEEGATIIRVGTAVFGTRPTPDSYYWPEKNKP